MHPPPDVSSPAKRQKLEPAPIRPGKEKGPSPPLNALIIELDSSDSDEIGPYDRVLAGLLLLTTAAPTKEFYDQHKQSKLARQKSEELQKRLHRYCLYFLLLIALFSAHSARLLLSAVPRSAHCCRLTQATSGDIEVEEEDEGPEKVRIRLQAAGLPEMAVTLVMDQPLKPAVDFYAQQHLPGEQIQNVKVLLLVLLSLTLCDFFCLFFGLGGWLARDPNLPYS